MSRFVTQLVLRSAGVLACVGASAGGAEGFFSFGAKEGVTIRLARGKEEGSLVGVVVSARSAWHQQQMNQTVLELRRVKEHVFRGRCSAYHVHASQDMEAWLDVAEASLLPSGDLRLLLKMPEGGSVQFAYQRVEEPERHRPDAGERDLAGEWADGAGAITVFRRDGDIYVGQVIRQASPEKGPAPRETIRVKAMGDGVHKGTIEFGSPDGKTVDLVEDIEVVVRGDTLTSVRSAKGGKVAAIARRLDSAGEKLEPKPKAAALVDPGDLCGKWRARNGDTTRYTRNGDRYTGYIVAIAPDKRGFGFVVGEEGVRLSRIPGGFYVGKVLVKTEGGKDAWWEDIEFTVDGDELRYTRYMVNGKVEKGRSARVGGLQDAPPAPKSP
ncbi:MAG TPA: hypothetical protein VNE39_03755 [Planctomycetota bacterium]|nr:hypothetical protein [Planctomycetota bacterium]